MDHQQVFCPLARHGVSINQDGSLDPCCQYSKSPGTSPVMYWDHERFDQQVRQKMLWDYQHGIQHAGCQKCYHEESLGWTSLRQHAINWYGDVDTDHIYDAELRLGNLCNLKCIMCNPGASSAVATERYVHRQRFQVVNLDLQQPWTVQAWWEDAAFASMIDPLLSQCRRINITGGEPFLIPQVAMLLQRLPESTTVSFNTNLTHVPAHMVDALRSRSHVRILVSLEGTEAMNDYLRYPSRWPDIMHNLQLLRSSVPYAQYGVNHTFQHASVYSLPALSRMCVQQDLKLHMTMVQGMPWMTLHSVPTKDLRRLQAWAQHTCDLDPQSRGFVINACDAAHFDPELYHKYRAYVTQLDHIRGTDHDGVFHPTTPDLN